MELKETKIDFVPMDYSACGMYRIRNAFEMMYGRCKAQLNPPGNFNAHGQHYIYTQRLCHPKSMQQITKMKNDIGCKVIIDFDDDVWHDLPSFNHCAVHAKDNYEGMKNYLPGLADYVTCTNDYLKDNLSEFIDPKKIIVIPNALNYNRWRFDYFKPNDELSFFYAGSPTHYDNKQYGDFPAGVVEYLKNKKVSVMGVKPWFLNAKVEDTWCAIEDYPIRFAHAAMKSKFVLSPVADIPWNHNKSDLKYLECAAIGRVCLCSESIYKCAHPYQIIPDNCTKQTFDFIVDRANENYDMLIKHQYDVLNSRWLRAHPYVDLFTK